MKTILFILSFSLFLGINLISLNSKIETDKLYIFIGEETFLFNLNESPITQELINVLPMKIKLIEENLTSKRISLAYQIDSSTSVLSTNSSIEAIKGDLLLYKGKELILINESTKIDMKNGEISRIGHSEEIGNLYSSITKNKSILLWNTLNYENYIEKVKPYGFYTSIMNYFTWKVFTFFCFLLL